MLENPMANRWDFLTDSQRFWMFVDKRTPKECWPWDGCKSWGGYGLFRAKIPHRKTMNAHRFAYLDVVGPIPKKFHVDHICRNRICVNPMHLRLLTNKENVLCGIGITAQNAQKTHCLQGHEFSEENTYIRKEGHRQCKWCRAERVRKFRKERNRAFARQ